MVLELEKKKKKKSTPSDIAAHDDSQNTAEDEPQEQQTTKDSEKGDTGKQGSASKGKGKGKEKGKGKDKGKGKGKGTEQPKLSKVSDDPLAKEVLAMILKGIYDPESQKDGKAFVPADWSTKFKPKLGPYKKFLQAHPDDFALVEDGTGNFIIKRPEDVDPNEQTKSPLIKGTTWQKKLLDSWLAYCLIVPREKRDLNAFLAPLPRAARETKLAETPAAASGSDKKAENTSEPMGKRKTEVEAEEAPPAKVSKKKKKAKAPVVA